LFTVSDLVTGDEFARYARYMVRDEHEIAAIMWTPYVSATQRAAFEQQLRQETGHQLGIIAFVEPGHHRVRAPQRDYYLPVHFLSQSAQVDPGLIGLDVHGRPANEALRRQSMQTGLAFTTPCLPIEPSRRREVGRHLLSG
jgi:CHASE1-domain containing sensor protein